MSSKTPGRQIAMASLLLLWGLIGSTFLVYWGLQHAAIRTPDRREAVATGEWEVTHFLAANCPCSRSLAAEWTLRDGEQVILLGRDDEFLADLRRRFGERVSSLDPEDAFRSFGVHGAPCLVISDPTGTVRYAGGYSNRRPGFLSPTSAVSLAARVVRGETVAPYPVYGCATAKLARRAQDPLGLFESARQADQETGE
ncbi:MAG: hypothetical protein AAF517_01605 [Planctomycetota bacterium]